MSRTQNGAHFATSHINLYSRKTTELLGKNRQKKII